MDPRKLSHQLRKETTPDLTRRRWIVGLNLLGVSMGQLVSLYQVGIISRLPDPPGKLFNATKVDASTYAYKRLQTPDALAMVTTYGITAWLAGAGDKDRAENTPALPIALALKVLYDAATALELGREEWQENHALCQYCQVATLVSLASVALAAPEALRALRSLRRKR